MQNDGKFKSGHNMPVISAKINPDGSITEETANGTKITTDTQGNIAVEQNNLRTAGIKHLAEVQTHTIHTIMGSTSHYIRFHSGGEVKFAYSNITGELIELSARKVATSISHEGEALFFCIPEN